MLTKRGLLKELSHDKQVEEAAKRQEEVRQAAQNRRWEQEAITRAEGLLAGSLGEAIRRWAKGTDYSGKPIKRVKLEGYRNWWVSGDRFSEIYGDNFQLRFSVAPDSKPTDILVESLKDAGFYAAVITEQESNGGYGKDGEWESAPGTHDKHYLVIDWS